jgi:putative transposase
MRRVAGCSPAGTKGAAASASTYNLTICTQPRHRNQLCRDDVSNLVRASLEFHETRGTWRLHACVLMPNHVHLIVTVPADTRLAHTIAYWKRYVAKEAGVRWQRDFFEHRLRRDEHFAVKVELRMNPVRAGLVVKPEEWPYFWAW